MLYILLIILPVNLYSNINAANYTLYHTKAYSNKTNHILNWKNSANEFTLPIIYE